jgi:tetratricopeptide (TPR) repeat protein
MEQAAEPGEVYLTAATQALAAHRIESQPLEPVSVKGISEPVPVFALRRVRSTEEAVPDIARTPFVGRRAELIQFRGLLEACIEESNGQTVYVRGEPGIGKTRLVEECAKIAAENGVSIHRGLVLPFGVGKGQDAIRSLVRSLLGIAPGSGRDQRQPAADKVISDGRLDPDQAVFLNDLLDLPQPTELRALYDAMDNATRNEGKQRVVSKLLAATGSIQPILAVIENVHWADAITLAHLAALAKTVAECPALLVMTSRIEGDQLDQGWRSTIEGSPFFTIDLGPLRKQDSIALISEFIDAADPLAESCLERAAGNPLFLEQLVRAAQEGSVEKLPDSVQSLVVARVDRLLPRDKRALQAASVVGQRFTLDLVRHLANDIDYRCDRLILHSLVRAEGESYLFAHALIQEGVYSSLLKRDRTHLHKAAADWFSERDPVLWAEHLDRAGDPAAAKGYLLAARSQAKAYRFESALRLAERGSEIAREPPERHELTCLKGELLHDAGASEESIATYRVAFDGAVDEVSRCEALVGVAAGMRLTTDYPGAMRCLDEAQPIAMKHDLAKLLAQIHHLRGNLCFPLGEIERCHEEHSSALRYARDGGSGELEARALGGLGDAAYAAGRMRTALEHYTACLDLCAEQAYGRIEIAYLPMVPFSQMYLCQLDRATSGAIAAAEAARRVRHDRAEMNALGSMCHIALTTGDVEPVEEYSKRGLSLANQLGAKTWVPLFLLWRGLMEEALGRLGSARDTLNEAASGAEGVGEAFNGARVQGALALVYYAEPARRDHALSAGESYLRGGSVSHNHLWFYRHGIESLLRAHEWERVECYARALEDFTRAEPFPWSDFFIARGRVLAAFGRGKRDDATMQGIQRLRDEAERAGLRIALPALEEALSST